MSFLVGDVVHILQFVKSSWNKFNYNNYIFVYILLDLTELKQTYLSSEKDEDSKQVSVISTDIGSIVATKDVECQFNYLVPSLGMSELFYCYINISYILDQLEYLDGTGVYIAGKTLFFIQGEHTQLLNWEEYGLRINVPHGTIPPGETCEVSIAAIVGGKFDFPSGTSLVSAIYAISVSRALLQPVQLSIQHCVSLETQEHTGYLSFVTADLYQTVLPYQFKLEQGGQFNPKDRYGSIMLSNFSFKAIAKAVLRPIKWLLGYCDDQEVTELVDEPALANSDTGFIFTSDEQMMLKSQMTCRDEGIVNMIILCIIYYIFVKVNPQDNFQSTTMLVK